MVRRDAERIAKRAATQQDAGRSPSGGCARLLWLAAPLVAAALALGCAAAAISTSSGGSGAASVSVAPPTGSVLLGDSMALTASVSNSSSTAVSWSVAGVAGGNPTVGVISASGLFTAPAVLPSPATVPVVAAVMADPTVTASSQITIMSDISVGLAPTTAAVELGAQQTFTATISSAGKPSTAVTWSLAGTGCSGSGCGMISSSGVFSAPQILPSPPTVLLTATSVADPSKSASVAITVTADFSFALSGPTQVAAGSSANYTATLTPVPNSSPSTSISWSVTGSGCEGTGCGTIATSGSGASAVYTAPAAVPSPNQVTITATPAADPAKAQSQAVTITPATAVTVSVAPSAVTLAPNGTQTFTATVTGTTNQQVSWSLSGTACSATGNPCGMIGSNGDYTAPATPPSPNSFDVVATSAANPSSTGIAAVTISTQPVIGSLLPSSATAGSAGGFTLEVEGANFAASSPGPGSTLVVGGTLRTTSCGSAAECSTTLAASDLATGGELSVQVQNPDGGLSAVVDFVVVPAAAPATIALTAGAPSATDENVTVVDLSTNGSSLPAQDVSLALAAMGPYTAASGNCTLGAGAIELTPPSSGSITAALCAFSVSGLAPSYAYTLTGPSPADIVVIGTDPLGLGIVYVNLQIPASAQTGARTLFVQDPELDRTAATGALDVQ